MPIQHPFLNGLVQNSSLTPDQADAIHKEHLSRGKSVREIILEQGDLDESAFLTEVARMLDTQRIDLSTPQIPPTPGTPIPASLARMYAVVPVRMDDDSVVFAVYDWPPPAVTDDLAFILSRCVDYVVATKEQVEASLLKLYGEESDSINDLFSELDSDLKKAGAPFPSGDQADLENLERADSTTPVIHFVNLMLYQAVKDRASDLHFEPFENEFKIRSRVDGALFEMPSPPQNLAQPIISRLKVISGLDIAESRLPQDGRIQLNMNGRAIDFRVSTLPTQFGESVVLRVLDRSQMQLDIDRIGFPDDIKHSFLEDIQQPNGLIIVTGPTGSGKTTTLYAALQHLNTPETKILTAEDPVEYDLDGLIQLPIRENIGLTFSKALRSFLRQDPDVIMVGEIRDLDTAQISIQAALTGHLVFSTLHTNDAPGAITRLIDMDVEPYLIASTLVAVMGQRLVRTLCPACKTAYQPDHEILQRLELDQNQVGQQPFYRGAGCEACGHSGYAGRRAIFEYLRINDVLRAAILEKQPTLALRNQAIERGMRTLREDGIRCILDGYTTVEEVVQYI